MSLWIEKRIKETFSGKGEKLDEIASASRNLSVIEGFIKG